MPRIVGVFGDQAAADAVIEQLQLNGIAQPIVINAASQLSELRLPEGQAAEYRRRLERPQVLLMVEAGALELPMVQRALRNGAAADIDILPETTT